MADKLVVDLVGSSTPGFTKDSLVPIYSSGKAVAPIILAFMKDLGVLDYTKWSQPIGQNMERMARKIRQLPML